MEDGHGSLWMYVISTTPLIRVLTSHTALLTFYVQTWDEYHTKTLTLGLVSGPVEGLVMLCLVYAFTGYVGGGSFWQQSAFAALHVPKSALIPNIIYNTHWDEWYMVQGGLVLTYNTISSAQNVVRIRRERGQKSRIALLGLLPFFLTWTLIPAYLYLQPVILNEHLVPFVFFAGLVNAYSVGQMITAHLVQLDFPYYNVLILPLAYGVFDSLGPVLQERIGLGWPSALGDGVYQVAYLFCMLGCGIGVYGSFVVCLLIPCQGSSTNELSRSM
jgi:ethanolaminephosphotransferase